MAVHDLSTDDHPTLRHEDREAIHEQLQHVVVVLTDLALLGKQAHWNLSGPSFRSLHLQLDEMIDVWRDAADQVAERAVALGFAPDGRARTVADTSPLATLRSGQLPDRDVVRAFTGLLTESVRDVRGRMEPLEDVDTVTADILHGVVASLEEQLWMVRVQAG